jgi:hypothetical protein
MREELLMSDYHVIKDGDKWKALKAGGQRASATADTKDEIQKLAKGFAESSGGGEVREHASRDGTVHKKGQIIDSDTHGKSDPKGNG